MPSLLCSIAFNYKIMLRFEFPNIIINVCGLARRFGKVGMTVSQSDLQLVGTTPVGDAPLPVDKALANFIKERGEAEREFQAGRSSWFAVLRRSLFESSADRQERLKKLRKEYLDLLYSRDELEQSIRCYKVTSGDLMTQIADADQALRKLTNDILDVYRLDFREWQHTREPKSSLWWWHLDEERFGDDHWEHNALRPVIYTLLAFAIIYLSLGELVSVADRISNFLINIFARSNLANMGLDLLTIGTFLVQILVGGRISLIFARRLTKAINRLVQRYDGRRRWLISKLFPVTELFIGTLLFVAILLLVSRVAVDSIGAKLRTTINQTGKSISERQNLLDLAATLDPTADRPLELTHIGLNYEEIGDYEQAIHAYEQALSAEPSLLVTSYLLAHLYAEQGIESPVESKRVALVILDRAVSAVEDSTLSHDDLYLRSAYYVPQFQYLLRVTRARVFFNMQEINAAIYDLSYAERIARNPANEALFIRWDNKPASDIVPAEGMPVPIPVTELYYLRAQASSLLFAQSSEPVYQRDACEYWAHVIQLANNRVGREVIWNTEAAAARRELQCRSLAS
jgi:tetratricopeptide (TPR) repeat protein